MAGVSSFTGFVLGGGGVAGTSRRDARAGRNRLIYAATNG
jgi:hypothetical protein